MRFAEWLIKPRAADLCQGQPTTHLQAGAGNRRLGTERGQVDLQSHYQTRGRHKEFGHTVGGVVVRIVCPLTSLLAVTAPCGHRLGVL